MIHETAIVSPKAKLHETVEVGPFAIIEDNVVIDAGSSVGSHARVAWGARVGKNVRIFHGAIVGSIPQDLKFEGEETLANIGDNCIIREYVTINRGTNESGSSDVGPNCLLMAYSHVAHDCKVGRNVIIGNCTAMAGHVRIDDFAIVSGLVPIHQFVRVGAHSMTGGGFRLPQDVCPYALIGGYPARVTGLNSVGLQRRDFPEETVAALKQVFKFLFFSRLNTRQALARIRDEMDIIPEVKTVLDFVEQSKRGIIK